MKRLARRLHRRFRSKNSTRGRKHSGRMPRLENLEPRQLLAADGLAFAESAVFQPDTLNTIPFVVEGNAGQPVAISFHVHATDGQLDPATPEVRTESGVLVPAIDSAHDYKGASDSLLIVQLTAGTYQIGVGGESSSTGSFDIHAGLPGDTSGNGQVSKSEYQHVTAAVVQSQIGFTNVSAQVFKKLGIDVSKNLYRSEHDVNGNGKIDSFDQSVIEASIGAPAIQLEFTVDNQGPDITAAMVGDTGRSSTDGITNNLNATINGTVSDEMPLISFTASVDGVTAVELGGLLGQDFSGGGSFSISRLQLEQVAGNVTVINNGSHTLVLTAQDQQGNLSSHLLTFEFDTVAPAAPTGLDLDASSDSGSGNSDNNTSQQQLLIHADAEDNAIVQFFSSLVNGSIGQATANSPVSTTTSTLPEGTQNITASSTDVAGNTSGPSDPLSVTVDTTPPALPEFDLDEDSDTGTTGDHLTTLASVAFSGSSSDNVAVDLIRGGATIATATANGEGDFTFSSVALPFGASSIQVAATDPAGNSSTSAAQSFTRNDAPVVDDQGLEVAENRPAGFVVGTVAATDANLGEGDSLIYEIIGGSGASVFAINASSGEITVVDPDALDFEMTTQFELTVRVTDHGGDGSGTPGTGLSDTATVTISLNDLNEAPVVDDQGFEIDENSLGDTLVGIVVADDLDEDDSFTFAITAGNTDGAFVIAPDTGEVRVANSEALDFETVSDHTFSLTVTVNDTELLTGMATVTITLLDVNDAPTAEDQSFDVSVKYLDGTVVGTVAADDQDADDSLSYSLEDGEFPEGTFSVDANTGEIRVFNADELEEGSSYTLMVQVEDEHGTTLITPIKITLDAVANFPPVARDDDAETDEESFVDIEVFLDNGHGSDTDPDDPLEIDSFDAMSINGATITQEGDGTLRYDPGDTWDHLAVGEEEEDTFTYTIMDPGGEMSTATVTVTVTGMNDAPTPAADELSTNEDTPITLNPLDDNGNGGDSDPDGNPIELTGADETSAHSAQVTLNPDGTITYDPRTSATLQQLLPSESIVDSFTYTISDLLDATSTGTVYVTVTGDLNANLTIFINGVQQDSPPVDVGVEDPDTPSYTSPIRTIDGSGRLHAEPLDYAVPTAPITLGFFFDTWRENAGVAGNNPDAILSPFQVLDHMLEPDEVVHLYVNGILIDQLGDYEIQDEDQIIISVETVTDEDTPTFAPIADQQVFAGAPLIIPLNGFDPNDQSLTFSAQSEDGDLLEPIVFSSSRVLSITIAGYGEMRFYLFEELVSGVTDPIIDLVESGELDGTSFHRIISGFVAQGLDPTGTGRGHPGLPDFDDQFHKDLQHTGSSYLSMAKGGDDTNGTQVFITDVNPDASSNSYAMLRNLDFNHSVFARLTLGENVRRLIAQVPTDALTQPDPSLRDNRPFTDVVVEDIRIITDSSNAVLMLKAPDNMTGTTRVTVTVSNLDGKEHSQLFEVTVSQDQFDARPFLSPLPESLTTNQDVPIILDLEAMDDEGDPVFFLAAESALRRSLDFDDTGDEDGVTALGTGDFSYREMMWSGGTVVAADASLLSSGTAGYEFGADGEIVFDEPISDVEFYFTHGSGVPAGTATARDEDGEVVLMWDSSAGTEFNDWRNFASYNAERDADGNVVGPTIKRIEFTGGLVDHFQVFPGVTVGLMVNVDNTDDTVTITPPAGFVGRMDVIVAAAKPFSDPFDRTPFDTQVIPITVLPTEMLTAAEGGHGQAAASIGADDPLLARAFQSALATWQTALGLPQLPEVQVQVRDLGGDLLGSATVVLVNSAGLPTASVITIDDDGTGRGWHTALDQALAPDRYDLYTVLLHEVGHALGFHHAVDALVLSNQALEAYFDEFGHVLGGDELMSDELPLGKRRLPSTLDIDILRLAYGLETGDGLAIEAVFAGWN